MAIIAAIAFAAARPVAAQQVPNREEASHSDGIERLPFQVSSAAGILELPTVGPHQVTPAVLILHDGSDPDARSGAYIVQLLGAGIAVLDLLVQENDGLAAALVELAAHPRVAGQRIGVLGFGAGARQAASLPATIAARALLYPGCASLPVTQMGDGAVLLLSGAADATNAPDACATTAKQLAAGGATVRWSSYPGATYAWDFPRHGIEGPVRLPTADGAGRVVAHPWPELAALSASQVAGFFATHLLRRAP